jgi:hypothetical protein
MFDVSTFPGYSQSAIGNSLHPAKKSAQSAVKISAIRVNSGKSRIKSFPFCLAFQKAK